MRPFDDLTPECVLDALDAIGVYADGRLLALNSYENRVYMVMLEDGSSMVAKFYRPQRWSDLQILEEHEFVAELVAEEIPAVAALQIANSTLHHHRGYRFALFPRRGGRAPDLEKDETLEWIGRFLGRVHAAGRRKAYQERPLLSVDTFGEESVTWLLEHDVIPKTLCSNWADTARAALDGVRRCYERAGPIVPIRLHGDCHAGNILWTDSGPHFVDFDDSRMGPPIQDLWMLLNGNRMDMQHQIGQLVKGYRAFCDLNSRELHVVEALRTLRLLHYSAWLARRWDDPAFPAAFPWFGSELYWQDRIVELREQLDRMDDAPLELG